MLLARCVFPLPPPLSLQRRLVSHILNSIKPRFHSVEWETADNVLQLISFSQSIPAMLSHRLSASFMQFITKDVALRKKKPGNRIQKRVFLFLFSLNLIDFSAWFQRFLFASRLSTVVVLLISIDEFPVIFQSCSICYQLIWDLRRFTFHFLLLSRLHISPAHTYLHDSLPGSSSSSISSSHTCVVCSHVVY